MNALHPAAVCLLLFALLFGGCATSLQSAKLQQNPDWQNLQVNLTAVPFHPQERYQCGPAALSMVLNASGVDVSPEQLQPQLYIAEKSGSLPLEMIATARAYNRVAYALEKDLTAIFAELQAGNPVLLFQNLGLDWLPQWHFAVAIGIDMPNGEIVLHTGIHPFYKVGLATFERTWKRAGQWAYVVLEPSTIPATATAEQYLLTVSQHEQLNQLTQAQSAFTSALTRWPGNVMLQTALGNNYYKQGNLVAAEAAYRAAVTTHPDYAEAHNNLAQTLLEQHRLTEALQSAQLAVELGGDNLSVFQQTMADIQDALHASK